MNNDRPTVMRMDLHCHSEASHDCIVPLTAFPERCLERGIHVQAITDHDQIWGAQQLKELVENGPYRDDLTIIVGEEVSTTEGEIVGLFLQERIPPGLTPEETVREIKAQGGLVMIPHGFDPMKRHRLKPVALERVADEVDIVEVFNARISRLKYNAAASVWATTHGVVQSGGSDAHTLRDIGSAWTETSYRKVRTPEGLLQALREGEVSGEWTHPLQAFVYKFWKQTQERLRSRVR